MPEAILSDYFYGDESQQFIFFKIPRQLITDPRFRQVSNDAKLLYGMLLDRMSLSSKRGWYDESGRVYIYYTVDEICGDLNCGRDKAMKMLAELDTQKGIGLIHRVKQGQGRPTKIYVKRFTTQAIPPQPAPPPPEEFTSNREADFSYWRQSKKSDYENRKKRFARVEKNDPSYTERNQTKKIHPDPSIPIAPDGTDRQAVREEVKEAIGYGALQRERPYEDVDSLLELMTDVLCDTAPAIRIGGGMIPSDAVRQRFRQLDGDHIRYVLDALERTDKPIANIRAYLLTALYNAPVTMGPFYSAAVRHDFRQCVSR